MLSDSETHARAVIEGACEVGPDLIYLATDMALYGIAQKYPLDTAFEGYIDLDYRDDGSVIIPQGKIGQGPGTGCRPVRPDRDWGDRRVRVRQAT